MTESRHRGRWIPVVVLVATVSIAAGVVALQDPESNPAALSDAKHAASSDSPSCCASADDDKKPGNSVNEMFVSGWQAPDERQPLDLSHELTRHDGVMVQLGDLIGEPLVVSFAYTRCTNPNKCQRVTRSMAALRTALSDAGLLEKVRLLLITYDAEWDTLQNLRDYARGNGLVLDDRSMFLKPPVDSDHRLFRDLGVTASFNPSGVTMHNIQMLLIDRKGRLARDHRILIWDNDQVVQDLRRLIDE